MKLMEHLISIVVLSQMQRVLPKPFESMNEVGRDRGAAAVIRIIAVQRVVHYR